MKRKEKDIYGKPIIYTYPNAIVRVYHPIITPEERARRMELIAKSAADLLREQDAKSRMNNK